ncbi:MAG: PII uridylyl-transferase [Elusimicrobia bacterium ADurb.Bin231]|nr:MAG: PII uridylyl-transferase [Elusimicrobia bacterium ADurb.Bin231]
MNKQNKYFMDSVKGIFDFRGKKISIIDKNKFVTNPVLMLMTYRLAFQLGCNIDKRTMASIKKCARFIKKADPEKIKNEIFLILSFERSSGIFLALHKSGIMRYVIPELSILENKAQCYYKHLGLLGHCFSAMGKMEEFYNKFFKNIFPAYANKIRVHLDLPISKTITRKNLLKFACLLHDIGKPASSKTINKRLRFFGHEDRGCEIIENISGRLCLSNDEKRYLKQMTKHHMRIGNLTSAQELTDKASFRFFRDIGEDTVDVILLSIADAYTYPASAVRTKHKIIGAELLKKYYSRKKKAVHKKLVNGFDIMKWLKIAPCPAVGDILKKIEKLQISGKINNKKDANAYAVKIWARQKKSLQ